MSTPGWNTPDIVTSDVRLQSQSHDLIPKTSLIKVKCFPKHLKIDIPKPLKIGKMPKIFASSDKSCVVRFNLVSSWLGMTIPPLTMEELFPLDEVELAEGDVVICWGDTSMELRPPEEVAEVSEDSGLSRFSSGLV